VSFSPPGFRAVPHVDALPVLRPFIAPEEIQRRHGFPSLLRLGANESAFGPPPGALLAMREAAARSSWYGDPESVELRERLATMFACDPAEVVVGAGIDDLMGLAVRAYAGAGGVAVATAGTYPTFAYHAAGYGARLVTVPYRDDFRVDAPALARAARDQGAGLVYLSNPDNPGGGVLSRAAVETLVDALPPGSVLLLDEAYGDFADPADLWPNRIDPRVVRMRTFSKAFGLAGARIGYAVASRDVIDTFNKIRLQYGVNGIAQAGALAALGEREFIAQVVRETARGREDYARIGERLGFAVHESAANFVLFDARTRERAERLLAALEARAVFVRKPGAAPLDRCIRVTVGTPEERAAFAVALAQAAEALA
jgi:histidinol-phosphate aminotransferase